MPLPASALDVVVSGPWVKVRPKEYCPDGRSERNTLNAWKV